MGITGPIKPKSYATPASASPTPSTADAEINEIITCTKTGRMWVKWTASHQSAMVPIRPEFNTTSAIYGESFAGVNKYLAAPSTPVEVVGLQLYSAAPIKMVSTNDGVSFANLECAAISSTGLTVSNPSYQFQFTAGEQRVSSVKVLLTTLGFVPAGTVPEMWLGVNSNIGAGNIEIGYRPQTAPGVFGSWTPIAYFSDTKCDMRKVVEANNGVRITNLPNGYNLGTDSSGNVVTGADINQDLTGTLGSDYTITAANTLEELTDFRILLGAAGQRQIWLLSATIGANHGGNHDIEFKIRNHTASTDLVGSKTSGAGYTSMSASTIITIIGSAQFRVYVQSTHTPVIKQLNGIGVGCTMFSAVRIA